MKLRLPQFIVALLTGAILFFGVGPGHALLNAATMPDMGHSMPSSNCQATCTPQAQPIADRPTTGINEQEIDPQPAEPYYLMFAGVGWSLVVMIAAAYLLKYLTWRPPDLIKLHAVYRF